MKHPLYPNLFSPIKINSMILKNRIMSAPIEAYWERSCENVALMVRGSGGSVLGPRSRSNRTPGPLESRAGREKYAREIVQMKEHGAKASVELLWCGSKATPPTDDPDDYVYGPCDGVNDKGYRIKAMNEEDMKIVCDQFYRSAKMIKELGFDAIMLHFGHGWGCSEFLWPHYNKRTDEYGGSIKNRIKFPRMCIQAVRDAVGPDFPLDMRISAVDDYPDGFNMDDLIYFITHVEDLLDMVNLSFGHMETWHHVITSPFWGHCVNTKYSEELKKHVHIPVAIVGAIMTPEEAEDIIAKGKADLIVLARASIADTEWATKALACRSQDIIPCIRCMECREPSCSVNPRDYHDQFKKSKVEKAEVQKKVVIVGGGPAGMEAALVAKQRGHDVTLFEQTDELGGQIKCADYETMKIDLKRYKDFMVRKVYEAHIDVRLGVKATPEMVKALNPDSIILAMGAKPVTPRIPGIDKANVVQSVDLIPQLETAGKRCVVLGGGSVGCEMAMSLSDAGREVTLVEMQDDLCIGVYEDIKDATIEQVEIRDINVYLNTKITEVKENTVLLSDKDGKQIELPYDTLVLATGFKGDKDEALSFYNITHDTNIIGDLDRVATVGKAVHAAYYLAKSI